MLTGTARILEPRYSQAGAPVSRQWRSREMVVREGDRPEFVLIIKKGWAARIRLLGGGVRQITGVYIPGDICETSWLERNPVSQPVVALSELHGAAVSVTEIKERADEQTALKDALWREAQRIADARSEWIVSLARRDAAARLAHIFCELLARQQANGEASGNCCHLPLTQHDLANLAGITPVHTNRTLQSLRARGLIELRSKRLRILDIDKLRELAEFDESYLPLPGKSQVSQMILAMQRGEQLATQQQGSPALPIGSVA